MNWDKLKGFFYVAKYGSYTAAAKAIGIEQSSLSRQVIALEEELGTKLFFRTNNKISITQPGEELLRITNIISDEIKIFQARLNLNDIEPEGILTIATTHSYAQHILTPHLKEFLETYPKMQLQIVCDDEELGFEFKKGDIVLKPIEKHDQDNFHTHILRSYRTKIFSGVSYAKEYGIPKTLAELNDHKLISYFNPSNPLGLKYFNSCWLIDKLDSKKKSLIVVNSIESYIECLRKGLGIGYLTLFEKHLNDKSLMIILDDIDGPNIDVGFITQTTRLDCKKSNALINFYQEKFSQHSLSME